MPPIVVDAGALDLLPRHVPSQVVLTPHANELSRLLTRIDEPVNAAEIEQRPLYFARRAARLTGATVLLKGALTIVVGPDDDSMGRVLVSGRAPATLTTAGAGDVLAGMTGALLAQQGDAYLEDPATVPETAAAAAYLHGLAASLASHATQHALTNRTSWDWKRPMPTNPSDAPSSPPTSSVRFRRRSVAWEAWKVDPHVRHIICDVRRIRSE